MTLEPETPYLLVPSLAAPGVEAPYELRLMSAVPLELVPLPEMQTVQLAGEWTTETAGGCNVNPLWRRNPKFHIVLSNFGRVCITLARAPGKRARHPVDDMLGLYILRAAGQDGEIKVGAGGGGGWGVGSRWGRRGLWGHVVGNAGLVGTFKHVNY